LSIAKLSKTRKNEDENRGFETEWEEQFCICGDKSDKILSS
jgi:hypothetical protein